MILPVLLPLVILLSSCGKKEEGLVPVISLVRPPAAATFKPGDTVRVAGTVDVPGESFSVRISLTTADYVQVSSAVYFIGYNHLDFETLLVIPSGYTQNGDHYIQVRAETDKKSKNLYQPVTISEIPGHEYLAAVVTSISGNKLGISVVYSNHIMETVMTYPGDYAGGSLFPDRRYLLIAGEYAPSVSCLDLFDRKIAWDITGLQGVRQHFAQCCSPDEEGVIVSFASDRIYGYRDSGAVMFDAFLDEDETGMNTTGIGDYVVTVTRQQNTGQYLLKSYSRITGSLLQSFYLPQDEEVIQTEMYNNNRLWILTTKPGTVWRVMLYDVLSNSQMVESILQEPVNCFMPVTEDILLLGNETGLQALSPFTGAMTLLLPGYQVLSISYSPELQLIWLNTGNELSLFTYPKMGHQKTWMFSDAILGVFPTDD